MTRWILALAWAGGCAAVPAQTPPAGQPPVGLPPAPTPTATPAVSPALWQHLQNCHATRDHETSTPFDERLSADAFWEIQGLTSNSYNYYIV